MLGLLTVLIAADWTAWYETQAKLRSVQPGAEQARWLQTVQGECERGDAHSCVYMLSFRHFDLKVLSYAVQQVQQACESGDCEGALYVANHFAAVYYNHPLYQLRERFPQDIYKNVCLRYGSSCAKVDLKACRDDPRCTITEDEQTLIQMRQGLALEPNEVVIRAVSKSCSEGVVLCRPKEMAFFKRDCPGGPGCFIAAYDMYLRTQSAAHEMELFSVLASASPLIPKQWLEDVKHAKCVRDGACNKALEAKAVNDLNVYLWPATATVVNELIEKKVQGNAKLAEAMAGLETKRAELIAARKTKAHEASALQAALPAPKTAVQSALVTYMNEREAEISSAVARYMK